MNRRILGGALVALALGSTAASARNFHCAGGIQYVIQGMAEKGKGNTDDAHRIFGKAVGQLTECTKEDPNDSESWSYLGWAYAEIDSAPQAGVAFAEGKKRLADQPKKLELLTNNWKAYWVGYYNAGLQHYNEAKAIMDPGEIPNSKDPKAAQAKAKLAEAEVSFKKATQILPDSVRAFNNLAIVQALQGPDRFGDAAATVKAGLAIDPNNADLQKRIAEMNANNVDAKLKTGDYDGALADLDAALARDPNDYGTLVTAAQTAFEKGDKTKEKDPAGAKAAYLRAMGYYAKAADNAPADKVQDKHDMRLNQAIAAQNAGDDLSEAKVLFALIQTSPKERDLHAMLRGAYDRMGSKKKSGDEVWVVLGLNDQATAVADVAGYTGKVAKASDAGKALASMGPPQEIKQFKADQSTIDLWYYWDKKQVYAFSTGRAVGSADFGVFGPEGGDNASSAPAGGAKGTSKPAPKSAAKAPVKKG